MNLIEISKDIIRRYQYSSGAYVASPNFGNYRYSWLRDGAFIAYAMDCVAEHNSADRFHHWVNDVVLAHSDKLKLLFAKYQQGEALTPGDFLPCRYNLDGSATHDDWPNFQLDGYGTWLWGLAEHITVTNNHHLLSRFSISIELIVTYLSVFWRLPNSDCWEENVDKIHPSTLACIHGGLSAINRLLKRESIFKVTTEIEQFLLEQAVFEGRFAKYVGSTSVDASLLWLAVPFRVFTLDHPYITNTVVVLEEELLHNGGVHRFPEDTYYGGGEWLLLSCWLGWYYSLVGRYDEATRQLQWVEQQADGQGYLTEQVLEHVNQPQYISHWENRWGKVAKPLLWSHAMYLVLSKALEVQKEVA